MSHWYKGDDGSPCFEVQRKDGKGMRATNIRDARQLDLVPSVTTGLKSIGSQALQSWIVDQHLKAAYENPPDNERIAGRELVDSESYKEWKARIKIAADEERNKAASFGIAFHDAVEAYFNEDAIHPDMMPWIQQISSWEEKNLTVDSKYDRSEFYINPCLGYGGRADRLCMDKAGRVTLIDFKTQRSKKDKFNFYPSWGAQLSAYMDSIKTGFSDSNLKYRLVSVVMDSENPDMIEDHDWDYEEGLELFKAAFLWWKTEHSWQPAVKEMAG